MIFKGTNRIILSVLFFSFLLLSCVSNSDDGKKPTPPSRDALELTSANLEGKWEDYFNTKQVIAEHLNINSFYRMTEEDGFSITYIPESVNSGAYYESNVFGDETVRGTYTIQKRDANSAKNDQLSFTFPSKKTGEDTTTTAYIPYLFSESYAFYLRHWGVSGGNTYKAEDIRYFRHTGRAPNYYPTDPAFKKTIVSREDLLGTWEFYDYKLRIDNQWYGIDDPINARVKAALGQQYKFVMEGTKQAFYEYVRAKESSNMLLKSWGEFKIIDDVINIKAETYDKDGELVPESYKLWVQEKGTSPDGYKMIRDHDEYRDNEDSLKEKEEKSYFKKVG